MTLFKKIKANIRTYHLIRPGDRIIVGVSGGPDSTALCYLLNTLKHQLGLEIYVAHFNHNLRKNAGKDERFVKKFADRLGLPCVREEWHHSSSSQKGSVEEKAREKRMAFFCKWAKKLNAQSVALAHTQDDLAETVLMRILRGSGLMGMRAILPKRFIHQTMFIRPLLNVTEKEILAFLKTHHLSYHRDPSNRSLRFFRNKIRIKLLPLLEKEYNPQIKSVLATLSQSITQDYDYLKQQTDTRLTKLIIRTKNPTNLKIPLPKFNKLHRALQGMLIRRCIEELKGDTRKITAVHLKEVLDLIDVRPAGSVVDLPHAMTVQKNREYISINITSK